MTNPEPGLDPYAVLEVSRDATPEAIRAAHRTLITSHHPDVHASDTHADLASRQINAARDLLLDPTKRRTYDLAHPPRTAKQSGGTAPPPADPISLERREAQWRSTYPAVAPLAGDYGPRDKSVREFIALLGSISEATRARVPRMKLDVDKRWSVDHAFAATLDAAMGNVRRIALQGGRSEAQDRAWWKAIQVSRNDDLASFAAPYAAMLVVEDQLDPGTVATMRRHWRWIEGILPYVPPEPWSPHQRLLAFVGGCIASLAVAQAGAMIVLFAGSYTNIAGMAAGIAGDETALLLLQVIGNIAFGATFGWLIGTLVQWLLIDREGRVFAVASVTSGMIGFALPVFAAGLLAWLVHSVAPAMPLAQVLETGLRLVLLAIYAVVAGFVALGAATVDKDRQPKNLSARR